MAAKKKKLKKEKKVLVFDENSRRYLESCLNIPKFNSERFPYNPIPLKTKPTSQREYLLGFHKRKNERRKKAMEELTKQEKERRKELKQEKKKNLIEQMEKHRKELEALESDDENEEKEAVSTIDTTYEHPEQVVMVTTINDVDLDSGKFTCIGPNKGLMETKTSQLNCSPLEQQNKTFVKMAEKTAFKHQQKSHKKFRRRRTSNKKSDHHQDGPSGKNNKRKKGHFHHKSKHFKKS